MWCLKKGKEAFIRGSTDWQITEIFKTVNDLGSSKHDAKDAARSAGAKTWEQVGQSIGIHSQSTYQDFTRIAKSILEYAKSEYGVKDVTKLDDQAHIVQSYLLDKISSGIERATYNTYSSAAHKFELALNRYSAEKGLGRTYDFGLKEVTRIAIAELGDKSTSSRSYENVDKLVENLSGKYVILGNILRETGFRISEASHIKADQMKGLKTDTYDGKEKFWIGAIGKGGKYYERPVSADTYKTLEKIIAEKGEWKCNQNNFREALKVAAERSGQTYHAPHGIRWSVASERYAALQKMGYALESSLKIVSSELSHNRADITLLYLE